LHEGEDAELRRIREFLLGGPEIGSASLADQIVKADEFDSGLRTLGLNRHERERLRQDRHRSKPRNKARDRKTAIKRLGYYIDERVDWGKTNVDRTEAIAAWAALSDHDVDRVNDWWNGGAHPLDFAEIAKLAKDGFRPTDLFTEVHGKTVVQHLRDGSSAEWCAHALRWERKRGTGT
jgi:hypothetical protein